MNNDDNIRIKKYKDKEIIKRLIIYSKKVWYLFLISAILTFLIVLIDLLPAYLLGEVVGILNRENITNNEKLITSLKYVGLFVGINAFGAVVGYFNQMSLQYAGQRIIYDIRNMLFSHIEKLSIGQINSQPVGKLVTKVTSDTNNLNELYTRVIINLFRYIISLISVIIVMIILSPRLMALLAIIAPILFSITLLFRYYSRKCYRLIRGNISNVNSFLSENISGMKITQIFNQESKKYLEFKEKNNTLKKSNLKHVILFGVFRPAIYFLYIISVIIVLYNGSYLVIKGKLKLKDLVKFYMYVGTFFNPIQQLAELFNKMQSAFASSERVFEILDTKIEILNKESPIYVEHFSGKIEFKHVWFSYNESEWILKDISFIVNPKETVAFVGATGAGKTTILALIVRNYDIQKGQILIDDIDIKDIDIVCLRKNIGQMLQDVFLFSGSIKTNLTLRDDSFTDEEIVESAKFVAADGFISKLDGGYDHIVRERGNNFSAGQRQLLSFARAVLHKPNIMILDEATANIDTETEVLIQNSLQKMMNIGTMLVVAHRLSTVQHADKIIVLNKGEIIEMGNHQELLHKKGTYYNLYELQYKHLGDECNNEKK